MGGKNGKVADILFQASSIARVSMISKAGIWGRL
jgi:hypothetical protein